MYTVGSSWSNAWKVNGLGFESHQRQFLTALGKLCCVALSSVVLPFFLNISWIGKLKGGGGAGTRGRVWCDSNLGTMNCWWRQLYNNVQDGAHAVCCCQLVTSVFSFIYMSWVTFALAMCCTDFSKELYLDILRGSVLRDYLLYAATLLSEYFMCDVSVICTGGNMDWIHMQRVTTLTLEQDKMTTGWRSSPMQQVGE